MKYLKKFENNTEESKYYYAVNGSDEYYFIKQLKKINCSENIIEQFLDEFKYSTESNLFISIKETGYKIIYNLTPIASHLVNQGYVFLGPIQLSQEEIKEVEMEKNLNKFNI